MAGVFRREAVEGQRHDWLGSIQLVRPVSLTVLTLLVVVATLAVGALLVEGRYTRKARENDAICILLCKTTYTLLLCSNGLPLKVTFCHACVFCRRQADASLAG